MNLMIDGIPRRNRMDHWSPGETAIWELKQKVEHLGAHPLLTDVVVLLGQAQERLADWVEHPGPPSVYDWDSL